MRLSKFLKILILYIFIFSLMFLGSCKYDNLGLSLNSSTLTGETSLESETDKLEAEVNPEQFFMEMLSKQKDKNPLKNINIRQALV